MSELIAHADWLQAHLGDPAVRVVDASWYLPTQERDARAEYLAAHIPGAVFFDIDGIADRTSSLPHMLPSEEEFSAEAGALGLSEGHTIVVYDGSGLVTAPRVWWTLRVFGARDVRILDGGLPAWKRAGLPLQAGDASPDQVLRQGRMRLLVDVMRDAVSPVLQKLHPGPRVECLVEVDG